MSQKQDVYVTTGSGILRKITPKTPVSKLIKLLLSEIDVDHFVHTKHLKPMTMGSKTLYLTADASDAAFSRLIYGNHQSLKVINFLNPKYRILPLMKDDWVEHGFSKEYLEKYEKND
jgi:hypothetical protein